MACQDVADGLVAHRIAEVGEDPGDAIVAPVTVVGGDPDNQLRTRSIHARPPRIGSLLWAIKLLGDQPPGPGQDCLGPDDACDLREGLAAQPLANPSQRPALSVAQGHAAREVRPEDAVLRGERRWCTDPAPSVATIDLLAIVATAGA